jgi:PTH1 family peptidyl-tRNA hydrolase
MKLVVGLGNPGSRYVGTRHNIGFDVVRELARRYMADAPRIKFEAEFCDVHVAGTKVMLVTPLTYMNLSGRSIRQFVDFFDVELEDLTVICDDINLDAGQLRWRKKGSAGGQNGLKSTIEHLGTQVFSRLRIGVGRPPGRMDAAAFVLSKFRDVELETMELSIVSAADSIDLWIKSGIDVVMNRFNVAKKPRQNGPNNEEQD